MIHYFKTWLYLLFLTALVMFFGHAVAGRQGLLVGFILSLGLIFASLFYSDKLLLWSYRARRIEGVDPYGLSQIVTKLAEKADIPKPNIYIIPGATPNAFATGRSPSSATVAATEGMISLLSKDELEAVLAHELSHVTNRDTFMMSSAATAGTAIMSIANGFRWLMLFGKNDEKSPRSAPGQILTAIFSPIAALLIRLGVRQSREFLADQQACELTQNPQALATALWKIHNYSRAKPMPTTTSTAHIFIINPLVLGGTNSLFTTHPPVEERIQRLIGRTL